MTLLTHPTVLELPPVIQGGMGVGISSYRLARATSRAGALGVVSGVGPDLLLARRLQDGDPDGDVRRALAAYPDQVFVDHVLATYFRPEGREGQPYRPLHRLDHRQRLEAVRVSALGAFAEVWLAKEGHDGVVGLNLLEKVQASTPATLLGALLAGVDVVVIGAGVPAYIPSLLDTLAAGDPISMNIDVHGGEPLRIDLDPADVLGMAAPSMHRPVFLAIVANHVLAKYLARVPGTTPDGFVVEAPDAGGHNAPPRGKDLDELGQPLYGPKDVADLETLRALGLPFWLAGGFGTPDKLAEALAAGARGVQVGTAFALCEDSGMREDLRAQVRAGLREGSLDVRTDGRASPTGFPFKVAQLEGTMASPDVVAAREKVCDLGYLRTAFDRGDGSTGYRCPGEPDLVYIRKGGAPEDLEGRLCLCNGLAATAGIGQVRADGSQEQPVVTLGSDLPSMHAALDHFPSAWTAVEVVDWLMSGVPEAR